jgi:Fe-S oxidoreductase
MEYAHILHRCFRCGYCKLPASYQDLNCPSYLQYRFETFSPGGRMWLLRAWNNGEIKTSPRLQQIMFSCAACRNCVEHCVFPKFKQDLLNALTAGRAELVNQGQVPKSVSDYLKAVHLYGNAFKRPETERGQWAEGLGLPRFHEQEFLFFAGDAGSFDERGQKMARAAAALLGKLGVSIGILAEKEKSDGNEVLALGERGLFEHLARQNLETFAAAGVKKIITLSPHAFHAFKNEYPKLGGKVQVMHYSQVLALNAGKLRGALETPRVTVAFHDPCYLGRHNQDYFTPRVVLGSLPGVEVLEMDRSKADALCCGGGGGNFFTDVLGGGPDAPARVRAREAAALGVQIMVVACPKCAKMLSDAIKAEELDPRLEVMDLAELVMSRLQAKGDKEIEKT